MFDHSFVVINRSLIVALRKQYYSNVYSSLRLDTFFYDHYMITALITFTCLLNDHTSWNYYLLADGGMAVGRRSARHKCTIRPIAVPSKNENGLDQLNSNFLIYQKVAIINLNTIQPFFILRLTINLEAVVRMWRNGSGGSH